MTVGRSLVQMLAPSMGDFPSIAAVEFWLMGYQNFVLQP
jgi:hypothetical protein